MLGAIDLHRTVEIANEGFPVKSNNKRGVYKGRKRRKQAPSQLHPSPGHKHHIRDINSGGKTKSWCKRKRHFDELGRGGKGLHSLEVKWRSVAGSNQQTKNKKMEEGTPGTISYSSTKNSEQISCFGSSTSRGGLDEPHGERQGRRKQREGRRETTRRRVGSPGKTRHCHE